ncbi:MAG: prolyl oligopeptidase family serine peptidase [Kiritimatiellae bacterium]|nr:prolyl oligopeptidase family serine peptidase [Kiritimatiellia bacterium]
MEALCGVILAASVVVTNTAVSAGALGSDFTSRITWETLSSFCHSNLADVKEPVRGIVVEHHGLGCVWFKPNEQKGWGKDLADKGIAIVHPHYNPWCWMNDTAVRFSDRIVDCVIEHYGLEPDAHVCSMGRSMGGLGALVYARYSRKNVVAAVANCPVCDLPYHYTERPDLPRTLTTAFADAPDFDAALKSHSPIDLVPQMPDINYFVAHSSADKSVNKERHSDRFVEAMRKAGRRIEYAISEGTGHCQLTPDVQRRFDAAVLAAFDEPEETPAVVIHSATTNGVEIR